MVELNGDMKGDTVTVSKISRNSRLLPYGVGDGAAGEGFSSGFLFAGGRTEATLPPINLISI